MAHIFIIFPSIYLNKILCLSWYTISIIVNTYTYIQRVIIIFDNNWEKNKCSQFTLHTIQSIRNAVTFKASNDLWEMNFIPNLKLDVFKRFEFSIYSFILFFFCSLMFIINNTQWIIHQINGFDSVWLFCFEFCGIFRLVPSISS